MKTKKIKKGTSSQVMLRGQKKVFLTLFLSFLLFPSVNADNSISQITTNTPQNSTQKKLKELEEKAKTYKEIIAIKQRQSRTLNDQIDLMSTNIESLETQMDFNRDKLHDLNNQIIELQSRIDQKNKQTEEQKAALADLVAHMYQMQKDSDTMLFLSGEDIASFMENKNRVLRLGEKISAAVDNLNELKKTIENELSDIESTKNDIAKTSVDLENQSNQLESIKNNKQDLLDQTKGEEARFSELLARVEQQKQQLLDIDQFFVASGLSADAYPKPAVSGFAPLSWYYSQKDPRWADMTIGNSKSTMKAYGCAISAIAMVFNEYGDNVTPGELAKQKIFSWDLISWPSQWKFSSTNLTISAYGYGHGNVNWSVIDQQIAKGNPVIVYIAKSNRKGGHYVVIHHKEISTGKYVVHDPYFGPNIYLDTSRALVGAMGQNSTTSINQMIFYN